MRTLDLETWANYTTYVKEAIDLEHWRIDVQIHRFDTLAGTARVAADIHPGMHHRAFLRIGDELWQETPEHQRHVILHELVHLHFHRVMEVRESLLNEEEKGGPCQPFFALLADNLLRGMEFAIDDIARALGGLVLTPDEWYIKGRPDGEKVREIEDPMEIRVLSAAFDINEPDREEMPFGIREANITALPWDVCPVCGTPRRFVGEPCQKCGTPAPVVESDDD